MRYLSLFSGIEAASVAWKPLGWEPVAFAEIEPFPSAVLQHHYPDVPNLGDITKITDAQARALGPVDLVVGGFPCQDLSVAGKRKGLIDENGNTTRSGLFFDAMRLVRAVNPRWLVIENVPGLFSSNGGRDFAAVVGEILGVGIDVPNGGWANTGAACSERGLVEWGTLDAQWFRLAQRRKRLFFVADFGDWTSRPPVLLERESLSGHPPPRREKGKDIAPTISARPSGGGGLGTDFDLDGGLIAVAYTLEARNKVQAIAFDCKAGANTGFSIGELPGALRGDGHGGEVMPSLRTGGGGGDKPHVLTSYAVRRLVPTECETLQGFPRNYTRIPWRGRSAEQCPDGPRYKALGNSMPVPVMHWIGNRIAQVDAILSSQKQEAA